MSVPAEVLQAVRAAKVVVCATHSPMDGDGLGCGLALQRALESAGKQFVFATEGPVPNSLKFLPGAERIVELRDEAPPTGDLLIAVDAGEASRVGRVYAERASGTTVLNIDHHVSNPNFGDLNWVDAEAAATGEQVFLLLDALGLEIDTIAAQALLVALVTDTGRFCYSSTTPRTLEIAAQLVRRGANPDGIQRHLFGAVPLRVMRLRGRAVDEIRFFGDGRVAVLTVGADYGADLGADDEAVKDLIDLVIGVEGVVVAALVRAIPGRGTKVSLRSKDDRANVAALAKAHGGGGHVRAAGFSNTGDPIATADRILPELEALAVAVPQ